MENIKAIATRPVLGIPLYVYAMLVAAYYTGKRYG